MWSISQSVSFRRSPSIRRGDARIRGCVATIADVCGCISRSKAMPSSAVRAVRRSTRRKREGRPSRSKDYTMRFMLTRTHDLLTKSLQDAYATELRLERQKAEEAQKALGQLHKAHCDLLEARLSFATEKLAASDRYNRTLIAEKLELITTIRSQQETLRTAMQDLVILKGGAGRLRNEQRPKQAEPEALAPDVEITDEHSPTDIKSRQDLLQEAEREYQRIIQGLPTPKVSREALDAAIPDSPEDWRKEHAETTGEISPIPGAAMFRD